MRLPFKSLLTQTLLCALALAPIGSARAGDPPPVRGRPLPSRVPAIAFPLVIGSIHISPSTFGINPSLTTDLQPLGLVDTVRVDGKLNVRITMRKTGVWPVGPFIARFVFRSPSTPVLQTVDVTVPPIFDNGGTFGVFLPLLAPVPAGYEPSLGYSVTLDVFNAVSENNEANNTLTLIPAGP
jgi:hypothetical protein